MRGLSKASLLFAPLFASAIAIDTELTSPKDGFVKVDAPKAHVSDGGSIVNFQGNKRQNTL